MSEKAGPRTRTVDQDLRRELQRALSTHFGRKRQIVELEHEPSSYGSSFTLEDVVATLDDGTSLELIFKDLSADALATNARKAKPLFLYDPLREIETYRAILAPAQLGTPTCYGAVVDHERLRYWLFLEKVAGVPLWQMGELATWQAVAVWLARMHHLFAAKVQERLQTKHLVRCDADFYRLWLQRAVAFACEADRTETSRGLAWLARHHDAVVERLISLPVTLIHGEFYPSNVLIREQPGFRRVCPIDWERTAVGAGLMDLAALTAGEWRDEDRVAVALAYREAQDGLGGCPSAEAEFLESLAYCRLQLAVQSLGWASSDWSPPPAHAHDWLGEALRVAEELAL
jgi:aminoglycoside phosphotransferase (APT) family kinase protein